jgi:peptidoglycan/LPS O-acetylase OafA/YrhL
VNAVSGSPAEIVRSGRAGKRLDSLTQARFFAALGVVLFHACFAFHARDTWYGHLSEFGFVGVSFFFVLSGFVLTWSSRANEKPSRFYWHRFARIWPAYALTWLAAVLYAAVGHGTVSWKPVVLGFALLQAWTPKYAMSYNFPAWSLSVEALFYALFPLLIFVLRRLSQTQALIAVGLGYLWTLTGDVAVRLLGTKQSMDWLTYSFPPYRLGEFIAGMGLAVAMGKGWRPRVSRLLPLTYLGALAVLNALWVEGGHHIDKDILTLLVIPATFGLVAALAQRDMKDRQRRSMALLRLGEASYALYISHAIVIMAWGGLKLSFETRFLLPYVALSIVVAVLLHRWIERPTERWLRQRWGRVAEQAVIPAGSSSSSGSS